MFYKILKRMADKSVASLPRRQKRESSIVNYVLVGSKSGAYGGPYDTSLGQVRLTSEAGVKLLAGYFAGDSPKVNLEDFELHEVRHWFGLKSFFDVTSIKQIVSLWRNASASLSHISFARGIGPMVFALFCVMRRTPFIAQTHGMLTGRQNKLFKLFDSVVSKPLIRASAQVVALTETEAQELLKWEPRLSGNISIIGNPPLMSETDDLPIRNDMNAIFIARLHPRKKVLDFAKAAEISQELGYETAFQVLGPDEGELATLRAIEGRLGNLKYLGATDGAGVVKALASSGVFVLTSESEPWGNVLVTAICLGKPVVITRSSALAGLVEAFGAGLVVGDSSPSEIAHAVHEILDGGNYEVFSRQSISLSQQHFSQTKVRESLIDLYRRAQHARKLK